MVLRFGASGSALIKLMHTDEKQSCERPPNAAASWWFRRKRKKKKGLYLNLFSLFFWWV